MERLPAYHICSDKKMMNKIFIAADHAGFDLKERIKRNMKKTDHHLELIDLGVYLDDGQVQKVDYPDYASTLARKVNQKEGMGILICGSGQGMCMRANKYSYVRAALCWDLPSTQLARQHNNANVLCLGSRLLPLTLTDQIVKTFFETKFDCHSRHQVRVQKISQQL